jgi:hypothetical protein
MPPLSRWCVRAALVYLVGGMSMGAWMLVVEAGRGYPPAPPWPSLHAHLLLVGFLLMLVFGVAFWMFPKVGGGRPRREAGWAAFALVNGGLLLRLLAEPQTDGGDGDLTWRALLGVAAVLPALGALAFAASIWPRVRGAMTTQQAADVRAARGLPPRHGR